MPIRLPTLRKARAPNVPFRRGRPPTRQATRLMQVSLGAGLGLLVVLGALFVPKWLEFEGVRPPSITLSLTGRDPYVVTVDRISRDYPLSAYRAHVVTGNATAGFRNISISQLAAPFSWGPSGNVTFSDVDADGVLSAGDAFTIRPYPGTVRYDLLVFYIPRDADATPPCPCAAGVASFV
ncbi:MAG TPA: hypothetical protein VJ400_05505 [Thermoplasmata archaeon]|nr:hypothetical protein [Thermoplasmata archaeon]